MCRRLEHLVGGDGGEAQWWRHLLDSNTRTGHEFRECWDLLQREANECCNYLGRELEGTIAIGPDIAIELRGGDSSRQALTEQREELREAVVRHPNHCLLMAAVNCITAFKILFWRRWRRRHCV